MTHDELRLLASKLEEWIADNLNSIVDLGERKEFLLENDRCRKELFEPLAILFDQAGSLYNIVLARICDPLKGHGKGTVGTFIEKIIRDILGSKTKTKLAELMDDDFDDNELEMKKGELVYSLKNLEYIMQHLKDVTLVYDKFFRYAFFLKKPWKDAHDNSVVQIGYRKQHPYFQWGFGPPGVDPYEDAPGLTLYPLGGYHTTELEIYLNNIFPAEYRWIGLKKVCYSVANIREFDTYEWWLENIVPQWDGVDRSDWLEQYCGVTGNHQWNCLVGMKLCFVAMVARCLDPGIHSRVVLVFEGDQNTGKSRLAAELAFVQEAFTKLDLSDGFKEAKRMIKGMAVVELADLGSVDVVNQNRMKDFISDENNRTRNMHQEDFDNEKRRSVMVLTVNNDNAGYLADITGNTRFAPVTFNGKVDIEGFQKIKLQLWAQALHLYRQGMRPWLTEEEEILQKRMIVNAERYFREYELCELFVENCKDEFEKGVTTMDVIGWCRDLSNNPLSPSRSNRSYAQKFVKGMERLGCYQKSYNNASGFKGNNKPNRYWHLPKEN